MPASITLAVITHEMNRFLSYYGAILLYNLPNMLIHYEVISGYFIIMTRTFLCGDDVSVTSYQPGNGLSIRCLDRVCRLRIFTKVLQGGMRAISVLVKLHIIGVGTMGAPGASAPLYFWSMLYA